MNIPDESVPMIARNAAWVALAIEFPNSDLIHSEEFARALDKALEAAAPHLMAAADKDLEQATRMVAALVLKSGGKVSFSAHDLADDFTVLTTTPNVATGELDIEAFQK